MFDENGLGDQAADASRSAESEKRSDDMNKKDDEISCLGIVTKTADPMACGAVWLNLTIARTDVWNFKSRI